MNLPELNIFSLTDSLKERRLVWFGNGGVEQRGNNENVQPEPDTERMPQSLNEVIKITENVVSAKDAQNNTERAGQAEFKAVEKGVTELKNAETSADKTLLSETPDRDEAAKIKQQAARETGLLTKAENMPNTANKSRGISAGGGISLPEQTKPAGEFRFSTSDIAGLRVESLIEKEKYRFSLDSRRGDRQTGQNSLNILKIKAGQANWSSTESNNGDTLTVSARAPIELMSFAEWQAKQPDQGQRANAPAVNKVTSTLTARPTSTEKTEPTTTQAAQETSTSPAKTPERRRPQTSTETATKTVFKAAEAKSESGETTEKVKPPQLKDYPNLDNKLFKLIVERNGPENEYTKLVLARAAMMPKEGQQRVLDWYDHMQETGKLETWLNMSDKIQQLGNSLSQQGLAILLESEATRTPVDLNVFSPQDKQICMSFMQGLSPAEKQILQEYYQFNSPDKTQNYEGTASGGFGIGYEMTIETTENSLEEQKSLQNAAEAIVDNDFNISATLKEQRADLNDIRKEISGLRKEIDQMKKTDKKDRNQEKIAARQKELKQLKKERDQLKADIAAVKEMSEKMEPFTEALQNQPQRVQDAFKQADYTPKGIDLSTAPRRALKAIFGKNWQRHQDGELSFNRLAAKLNRSAQKNEGDGTPHKDRDRPRQKTNAPDKNPPDDRDQKKRIYKLA